MEATTRRPNEQEMTRLTVVRAMTLWPVKREHTSFPVVRHLLQGGDSDDI
jgi:hypothetical protein